ncbi:MAG: acetylglutamate kinase [Lachnospiraceae bacterium]|nr:acetylglutamate kinase [Lachnospiraceae bacterium]
MMRRCVCNRQEIINQMRMLWLQHVYRTRFFIISTVAELGDLKYVTDWLLENPGDFAQVLKFFYGAEKADAFKMLLTEHLQIGGALVNADQDNDISKADRLREEWYENADEIALFLARINPNWNRQKWQNMLDSHLSMTEQEAAYRLRQEYPKDIQMFDAIEKEALEMADYMALGLIRQKCCNG